MDSKKILVSLKNGLLLLRPLSRKEKEDLLRISTIVPLYVKKIRKYLRQKRIRIKYEKVEYSERITHLKEFPVLEITDDSVKKDVDEINSAIKSKINERLLRSFSAKAWSVMPSLIAPHIVGFDEIKKAVALQLFAVDPLHILLLGDPGTGKTDILRAGEEIAPISAFGLGSGTSNTGLTVTVSGSKVQKGILSLAHNGLACIDELNLMKTEDRAGLYNVMEKSFVSYDKGGNHYKFPARCSLLATGNPRDSKFRGRTIDELRKQIPFDNALLSRFHLIFMIREYDVKQFLKIADQILRKKVKVNEKDIGFLSEYIKKAREIEDISFNSGFQDELKSFIGKIKSRQDKIIVDITPRFVVGLKRLIECSARMELRNKVEKQDIKRAVSVFGKAFEWE